MVAGGRVKVRGVVAHKPATQVDRGDALHVVAHVGPKYVSRGANKLVGALAVFADEGLSVAGRRCLDAGASTGGFTDVLLRSGAAEVVAVDVGYGQLAWQLRQDPRVSVHDRTNVRSLTVSDIGAPVDVVVADLSFISLSLVLPALAGVCTATADMLLMVKPQFEVGKDNVGAGGVVRDVALRAASVRKIGERAADLGWGARGVTASPLPGPAGNVEYFLWLRQDAPALRAEDVEQAVAKGPA